MKTQISNVKCQNYTSKLKSFKILVIVLSFEFCVLSLLASSSSAADSTPSADIKIKLEELKKEIASKAAKLKQEITNKLKDKAYTGSIKSKSDTSLTLATSSGPKIVGLNQDTVFNSMVKSKQKFSQKTMTEEDYLAALGDVDDTNVLTAKKIILSHSPKLPLNTFLWGKVVASSDKLTTIKDRDGKSITVTNSSQTILRINDFVILTGRMGKNEIFDAEFVYTIPQGGILKPKKFATPSTSPSSSSSVPKQTPKPTSR